MKKRRLKGFVLPTLYLLVIGVLFVSISFLGNALQTKQDYGNMAVSAMKNTVTPVVSTPNAKITKPYQSEKVSISKSYYDMLDEEGKQQQSLVYYENTYLQNSGVLYSSDESFEIISVYDGTISKVSKDDILGNVIEITHNTNLKSIYYSLNEVSVKQDDVITSGTVIGKSGDNKLEKEKENCLLFEVFYNGISIDPEEFYNMDIKDLQ
ncbi:MAG: M23 family metallopeptidase [Bacilli bacterium]